jgi:primosomal protein N''
MLIVLTFTDEEKAIQVRDALRLFDEPNNNLAIVLAEAGADAWELTVNWEEDRDPTVAESVLAVLAFQKEMHGAIG